MKETNNQVDTPRMSADLVNQLMIYLLLQPGVVIPAIANLKPEYFSEPHLRLLWQCVLTLTPTYGASKIPFDALYLTTSELLDQPGHQLPDSLRATLLALPADIGSPVITGQLDGELIVNHGLLYHAYNEEDPARLNETFGMELLKRFLNERSVVDTAIRTIANAEDQVPGNFEAALDAIKMQMIRIQTIDKKIAYRYDEFPEEPEPINVFSTGVSYLDELMDGGAAPGEVYVVVGTTKTGKSFFTTQLCVRSGEYFHLQHNQGGPRKEAFFISYEMTPATVNARIRSCGADVDYDRLLTKIKSSTDYSTIGHLLQYEQDYYTQRGKYNFRELPGERERIRAFMTTAGQHIATIDFKNSGAGNGGVDEIVAVLNQQILQGHTPGLIAIDYLNLAVTRQIIARNGDLDRQMRHGVRTFFQDCITKIAVPFKLPVFILQQFNAEANAAAPSKILKGFQSAESRTINQDADFIFCLGQRDKESNVSQLYLDLCRRTCNGGKIKLIQLQGNWARWVDVSGEYELGAGQDEGRIVKKAKSASAEIDTEAVTKLRRREASPDPYKAAKKIELEAAY